MDRMEDTTGDFFSPTLLPMAAFNDSFVSDDADIMDPMGGSSAGGNHTSPLDTGGFCGTSLKAFEKEYRKVHGYTSLIVCLFGAQANILNLIVLTRREMINPTNAILTGLALADLLNMLEYIPYAVYMTLPGSKTTWAWAVFVLIHSNFSQVCHTISIWLTVTLAVWRYIMVAMHVKCKTLCSMERAKWAITSAYVTSPLLCIPIYLSFSITPLIMPTSAPSTTTISTAANSSAVVYEVSGIMTTAASFLETAENMTTEATATSSGGGDMKYIVNLSELAKNKPLLMTANFWLYRSLLCFEITTATQVVSLSPEEQNNKFFRHSLPFFILLLHSVVIKIIPCILLTLVSHRLISSLTDARRRKDMLLKKRTSAPATVGGQTTSTSDHESGGSDRTTRMLLAILLLFLITEFPQGILGLLSGVLGDSFFKTCYIPLADVMDFFALLNSAINFILYCSMSKKFRDTFSELFKLNRLMMLGTRQRNGSRVHNTMAKAVPIHSNHNHLPSNQASPAVIQESGNSPV